MPRFCFFLNINHQIIEDWAGREMPDLQTAELITRLEYAALCRSISPSGHARLAIEIRNPSGELLTVITAPTAEPELK